jgi:fructose transport system permease protein
MVMALGGIVMTKLAARLRPAGPPLAIACGMAVTTMLFGLVNGLLVTRIKLPPFIVTLGTLNIAFAITQLYSTRRPSPTCPAMTWLGNTFKLGGTEVVWGTVLMLAAVPAGLVLAARDRRRAAMSTRWATTPRPRA